MTIVQLCQEQTVLAMEADMRSIIARMGSAIPRIGRRFQIARRGIAVDTSGNFALFAALVMTIVVTGVGASIDFHTAYVQRNKMQQSLDAAVLVGVKKTTLADQKTAIQNVFEANFGTWPGDFNRNLSVVQNSDKSITAVLRQSTTTTFMALAGIRSLDIAVKSSAIALGSDTSGPCIYVLGSSGQDVLINSGANVQSTKCSMDVHSTANPAFIMNSGSTINFTEFCVKGTNYIKNGGTLNNLKTGCSVHADPYAGTLTEPTVSSTCVDSGYYSTSTVTLEPGVHCGTGFNGSPTITFKPGLHIIKGTMIINSGATVIANGVTFYFPDVWSGIQANGGLTFTATAPTSGTYKGILMFEKTSDAANNANKSQYIFNGSKGETLEGIIYLPNRNVTYNSTTSIAEKISMVVNQIILNSASWQLEPYTGTSVSASNAGTRLTE
jgi:Flp pilus assembly protein TadG